MAYYLPFDISDNSITIEIPFDDINANIQAINLQLSDGFRIIDNTIEVHKGPGIGIFIRNSNDAFVENNKIDVFSNPNRTIHGIQLENSSYVGVNYNFISNHSLSCDGNTGIFGEDTFGKFKCNKTHDFIKGIWFNSDCDNSLITGNIFSNNEKDFVLGYSGGNHKFAVIGKQGDFSSNIGWGNIWTDNLGGSAYNYSDEEYVLWSQFLVNAFVNPVYKPMTIVAASNDWFWDKDDVTNESSCTLLPHDEHHEVGPEDFDCTDFINKIIQIDTSRALDDCKKDIWKYHYFKKLLVMKKLDLLTGECLSFFNINSDNVLVKIAKMDSAITNILINQTTDSLLYENIVNTQADLNELHDQGMVFAPQYQQTMTLYNQLLEDHSDLMEVERAEDTRKADSIKNVISTINVSDTCLSLLLRTFDIELDFIKSDTLTAAQLTQVRDISELCPYVYGDGVYLARALRSIFENVRYESIEECAPERLNPRSNEKNLIANDIHLYPNPATDELNISLNDADVSSGNVQILDITGKAISEFRIDRSKSEYRINTGSYKSGLYFIKYTSDSGHEIIEKFVILK